MKVITTEKAKGETFPLKWTCSAGQRWKAVRSEPGLDGAARKPGADGRGAPPGRRHQLLGATALPITAFDKIRSGSKNNNHTKRADKKEQSFGNRGGSYFPFPGPPVPPPLASPRAPAEDLDSPGSQARQRLGTDRRTNGRRRREQEQPQGEQTSGGGAAAAPLRHNAAGPLAPLPGPPNWRARAGVAPGRPRPGAGAEGFGARHGRTVGDPGAATTAEAVGVAAPSAAVRTRARSPGQRALLCLTDSDPPRPPRGAPRPAHVPPSLLPSRGSPASPAGSSCARTCSFLLYLWLFYLYCLCFSPAGFRLSFPPTFGPRLPLCPPPLRGLSPLKSPLTVIHASTAVTSLVPKPFLGSSINREGENGRWA
ncbi:uncharacterized protein ACOB7L_015925 [Callospermophilus lateralis]|uniref:uncharacterized protein LOC143400388 n=1 Tax=Callospermophilus lateralis TaxID=76772 RepID=UPI004038771E